MAVFEGKSGYLGEKGAIVLHSRQIRRPWSAVALVGLIACAAVSAHHSYAMFDLKQSITLQGPLIEFQWTNPHCFIQVMDQATQKEWSVEMGAPADLYRKGWRPGSIRRGDTVTVVIHPTRDGSSSGTFVSAIGPDGKPLFPGKPEGKPASCKRAPSSC
jgi:hypothetical protein